MELKIHFRLSSNGKGFYTKTRKVTLQLLALEILRLALNTVGWGWIMAIHTFPLKIKLNFRQDQQKADSRKVLLKYSSLQYWQETFLNLTKAKFFQNLVLTGLNRIEMFLRAQRPKLIIFHGTQEHFFLLNSGVRLQK